MASVSLIAPAGTRDARSTASFIDGFIAETRARKLKTVLQNLVADPSLISADMVEDVIKYKRLDGSEAALRRIAGANFGGGAQNALLRDALAARQDAYRGDRRRGGPHHSPDATPRACPRASS